jgi:hypothetical protein
MIKHPDGVNTDRDGNETPRFRYELTQQEHDDGFALFVTGPIAGTFVVDGTSYDVTEWAIPVKTEHVGPLHIAIHRAHQAAGRFLDSPVPELADVSVT